MKQKLIISFLILALYSCKKEDSNTNTTLQVDVYVLGGTIDKSVYWKNGVPLELNISSPRMYDPQVNSIAVSGDNVYVAGCAYYSTPNSQPQVGVLWKNGIELQLFDEPLYGQLNSVALSNNDVYTVQVNGVSGISPQYLKNGNPVPLSVDPGFKTSYANSIAVSGNDIYVAGIGVDVSDNIIAIYWKNGEMIKLSDGSTEMWATSIAVSGSDVYVAGREYGGTSVNGFDKWAALYWKNGEVINLTDGSTSAGEPSIAVSGTDVYAAVDEYNGKDDVGKFWKNGKPVNLTGGSNASGVSIAISETDVYVAGTEYDGVHHIAKYWKNGNSVTLGASSMNSYAVDIFLQPR